MAKKRKTGVIVTLQLPTARVRIDRMLRHPVYEKQYPSSRHLIIHVPEGIDVGVGDTVVIEEAKPISKRKSWKLVEVTDKASLVETV